MFKNLSPDAPAGNKDAKTRKITRRGVAARRAATAMAMGGCLFWLESVRCRKRVNTAWSSEFKRRATGTEEDAEPRGDHESERESGKGLDGWLVGGMSA